MHSSIIFIKNFINRKGGYIFGATIIARFLAFLASWIALQLIPDIAYGYAIYAHYLITFIVPFAGFGLGQGLVRYGSQLDSKKEKDSLFLYVFKKGSLFTVLLIIAILLLRSFLSKNLPSSSFYIVLFAFSIYSFFLLDILKILFRIQEKNKLYAALEVVYNVVFVICICFLSKHYVAVGYALSFIIAPLITFIVFIPFANIDFSFQKKLAITNFSFYKYSFFSSLSNVAHQLLLAIDILLIGNILKDTAKVTAYKYSMLVPFSFLLFTKVIMATDYVTLAKKIHQKKFIKNYIKNYLFLFSILSILSILFSYFFGTIILRFFKESYTVYFNTYMLLTIAMIGVLLLRGLYDNLLSAMGKANIIYFITTTGLLVNYFLNNVLIPEYELQGAAITTLVVMWLTGFISMAVFYYHFNKEKGFSKEK